MSEVTGAITGSWQQQQVPTTANNNFSILHMLPLVDAPTSLEGLSAMPTATDASIALGAACCHQEQSRLLLAVS